MSEYAVKVCKLLNIQPVPNSDNLSMAKIEGYNVIWNHNENPYGMDRPYREQDEIILVLEDSVVPENDPRWAYLGEHRRIKAKRLRGVFSMAVITPSKPEFSLGQDVREQLGITRYTPPEPVTTGGDNEKDPGFLPHYTDIASLRRYEDIFVPGEQVIVTEKLDGANGRWLYKDGRLWVGSHSCIKSPTSNTVWWRVAKQLDLEKKLEAFENIAIYGEVYGYVQSLRYGAKPGEVMLAVFDAMDVRTRTYFDHDKLEQLCKVLELPMVPVIYNGPFIADVVKGIAEGKTTIKGGDNIREGVVIKPVNERFDERLGGRVILKYVSEQYLLKKK